MCSPLNTLDEESVPYYGPVSIPFTGEEKAFYSVDSAACSIGRIERLEYRGDLHKTLGCHIRRMYWEDNTSQEE